ncbi:MAG: electron transfer flavoprotein subunit beta/FixA family protein [SAR324 cluster bacterium]|nr:electron transfer flavoprotein subunit beta/FixA family protein [SAR324 cluster bacterium]
MNILVCVKRVPDPGTKIELTADSRAVDTSKLGFTISPHEECAVEEAVQMIEEHGGEGTVLTLGLPESDAQLRDALAVGMERGILIETDGSDWDPGQTAKAIAAAIEEDQTRHGPFDLLMFGNESADSGGFQVGIRVANALDLPCITGVKSMEMEDGQLVCKREYGDGWEVYKIPLPAVVTVKEGLNLPRHPSLRGTMKAKKKKIEFVQPEKVSAQLVMNRLRHPAETSKEVEILGEGAAAAPKVIELLRKLEVL